MILKEYLRSLKDCPDRSVEVYKTGLTKTENGPGGCLIETRVKRLEKIHPLNYEYGISDNWQIFLKTGNYEQTVESLAAWPMFELIVPIHHPSSNFSPDGPLCESRIANFQYAPGSVVFDASDVVRFPRGDRTHKERQRSGYNMTLMLFPYRHLTEFGYDGKVIEGVKNNNCHITTAMAVAELGKFILKNRIPACFPNSVGEKYWIKDELEDYSGIVYYQPRRRM